VAFTTESVADFVEARNTVWHLPGTIVRQEIPGLLIVEDAQPRALQPMRDIALSVSEMPGWSWGRSIGNGTCASQRRCAAQRLGGSAASETINDALTNLGQPIKECGGTGQGYRTGSRIRKPSGVTPGRLFCYVAGLSRLIPWASVRGRERYTFTGRLAVD
jgi:hypothetical protein